MTFEEDVTVAMLFDARGHPADRVNLGPFDVDLHEIDALFLTVTVKMSIEKWIKGDGPRLEVRHLHPQGGA